jgi:dTDP-4-amino-4,6-dideoxygalactose transaminase
MPLTTLKNCWKLEAESWKLTRNSRAPVPLSVRRQARRARPESPRFNSRQILPITGRETAGAVCRDRVLPLHGPQRDSARGHMTTTITTSDFVPFAPPDLSAREIGEVVAALESGWLSTGPRVRQFERAFAEYVGAPHAVAVNSCTAALHLSLLAAGVRPGDEVVTTPLTFCATANVAIHAGATPVFADIDPVTLNLDPHAADAAITGRSRAIVPVHYAGLPADMRALLAIAKARGLAVVEDAAHCVEGVVDGRKVGAIGDFTCFSFYATKNLTTGEGGMVTLADDRAAELIRVASLHGMSKDAWTRYAPGNSSQYDVVMAGFKYNMTDIQAAIGLHQLARLEDMHARRSAICARYDAAFASLPLRLPARPGPSTVHARHLYAVIVDERAAGLSRDALQERLRERGIATSIHFRAVHLHPYYRDRFGLTRGMFPVAEAVSDTTLSLPLSPAMTPASVERVIEAVHASLR